MTLDRGLAKATQFTAARALAQFTCPLLLFVFRFGQSRRLRMKRSHASAVAKITIAFSWGNHITFSKVLVPGAGLLFYLERSSLWRL